MQVLRGRPFMIYRNGRKVLAPLPEEGKPESFYLAGQGHNPHNISEAGFSHSAETPTADEAGNCRRRARALTQTGAS